MPAAATASMSSGTRTTLSISEYSVCRRRCTKPADTSGLRVGARQGQLALDVGKDSERHSHRVEGAAVLGRGLAVAQRLEMRRRAIALVRRELEARIAGIERLHHGVPMGLRENGSRADRGDARIALDDGLGRAAERQIGERRKLVTVDL